MPPVTDPPEQRHDAPTALARAAKVSWGYAARRAAVACCVALMTSHSSSPACTLSRELTVCEMDKQEFHVQAGSRGKWTVGMAMSRMYLSAK